MLNPDRLSTVIPVPALVLGLAGLVPFAGLAAAAVLDTGIPRVAAVEALLSYAAIILSFMGGVQWGLAMRGPVTPGHASFFHYAASVVPALVGWFAFVLLEAQPALVVMATAFALLFGYDVWAVRRGYGPPWYPKLRLILTTGVVAALCATSAFGL